MAAIDRGAAVSPKVAKLLELWIDGSEASLREIPAVSEQLTRFILQGSLRQMDFQLIRRAALLASAAQTRALACLQIQTRVGTYSARGAFETSTRVATADWEG